MKPICILLFTLSISTGAQTKWEWIFPQPQGNTLHRCIVKDSVIIAIGENSTIIRSTDHGVTWQVNNSVGGDGGILYDLSFYNQEIGFACGENGKIIETIDAGKYWTKLLSPTNSTLYSISFVSPLIGWCGGMNGKLFKTTDGGNSWVEQITGSNLNIQKICFLDYLNGYIVSSLNSGVAFLKTTDGGTTWHVLPISSKPWLRSMCFVDRENGWVVGDWGTILNTTDGGLNWNIQKEDSTYGSTFNDIYFVGLDTGWVVGSSYSNILATTNGGKNWNISSNSSYSLLSIHGSGSTNLFAVGSHGQIYFSSDAGNTWLNRQRSISNDYLKDVFFYGDSIGWTFDNDGYLFKTVSSGKDWTNIGRPLRGDRMFFTNSTQGWMVGGGYILKTTDGGQNWSSYYTSNEHLYDLFFVNDSTGWVVGRYGSIFKTSNSGLTWTERNIGVSYFLSSVYFTSKDIGWVSSFSGLISKTTDGGDTWIQQYHDSYYNFRCLFFLDSLNGWVCGQFNALVHTTDGGNTWVPQEYESSYGINDIKFIDGIGYAVGEVLSGNPGLVIRSTDHGETWQRLNTGAALTFYGVHFASKDNGWIVGESGAILHTSNGSVTSVQQNKDNIISSSTLFQNYPNPFNPVHNNSFSSSNCITYKNINL